MTTIAEPQRRLAQPAARVAEAAGLWAPAGHYLNTATFGLPPLPTLEAVRGALHDWQAGADAFAPWSAATERSRAAFGRLVGAPPQLVATGATVSEFVGVIAASLPDRARVLAPDVDFTSVLFPFLAQADRGVELRTVPPARLAEAIDGRTDLVAFSAVQSASGEVADLAAVRAAASHHGARTLVDATQACGWLPLRATDYDYLACGAYKWLLAPRGSAFLTVRAERLHELRPHAAGWFAGEDPGESMYGPPLRLAGSARRLDVSPAWFSWVGTEPSLEVIARVGVDAIHAHDVALANRLRHGLGMPPSDSAIVAVDRPGAAERLAAAGVRAAVRNGVARLSCHLYNTAADVDAALDALVDAELC